MDRFIYQNWCFLSEQYMKSTISSGPERISVKQQDVVDIRWRELNDALGRHADFQVSEKSKFKHDVWDYRGTGGFRLSFLGLATADKFKHSPLYVLVKLVSLNLIGFYARQDRSPRTIYNILNEAKPLFKWLIDQGFMIADTPGGFFEPAAGLQPENFQQFIGSIADLPFHENTKCDRLRFLNEWWKISCAGEFLPSCLRLNYDPFDGHGVSNALAMNANDNVSYLDSDDDEHGWEPIPLEIALPIAQAAIENIEVYGSALVRFYHIVYEGYIFKRKGSSSIVTRGAILKLCKEYGITIEELGRGLPFELEFEKYVTPSDPGSYTYRLNRLPIEAALSYMKRAAVVVVLFTTGMRSREIRELRVGCCVQDLTIGVADFFRMTVVVKKTSREYYAGQEIKIPVPKITHAAVCVLESLGKRTRASDYLLSPLISNGREDKTGAPLASQSLTNYVHSFCRDSGVEYLPHPHQFRKTIAGWFVMNSPVLAPILVMTLFSHRSISMTEMYFRNNYFIRQAREEVLIEQSQKLIKGVSHAAQKGKVAGIPGERIMRGVKSDPLFNGLTGDELGTAIEVYLAERATNGSLHFLLTPMAICVFNPEDNDLKPCTKLILRSRESDSNRANSIEGQMPFTSKCVGIKCEHCLITECQSTQLKQSLTFYQQLIEGSVEQEYAENLHLMSSAKDFIQLYKPILECVS